MVGNHIRRSGSDLNCPSGEFPTREEMDIKLGGHFIGVSGSQGLACLRALEFRSLNYRAMRVFPKVNLETLFDTPSVIVSRS